MPLLTTLGNAGIRSYGISGIMPGGSALINATGAGLQVPASANFAYGTGNFTIEMWVYPYNYNEFANVLWAQTQSRPSYFLIFIQQNTGQISFQYNGSVRGTSGNAVTLNAWNHVAVVRNSGTVKIYVNGVGSGTASVADNISNTNWNPTIGRYSHAETVYSLNGLVTNVRVAKSAIYTADFTPSRTPFTRTSQGASNVQLLLNFKNSAGLLTDSSANNLTVTNMSSLVSYNTASPYTVPYVTPPTVVISSAVVTPNVTTLNEGQTVTFSVAGTNTPNGTYYYTIEQAEGTTSITSSDFTLGALSGSFTITSSSGSIPLTLVNDLTTEGTESFVLFVRTGSTTGPIIGSSAEVSITDSSITPVFTSTPTSINEGSSGTFTVQNIGPDGTYYWTVLNGTSANADFSATSGSFTVSGSTGGLDNGSGSFSVTPTADSSTEGSQTFQVQVRSGSTSGTVIITSASVTINDTSQTPYINVSSSVNEGVGFNIVVGGLQAGTYYWTINNTTTSNADFSATSGSFTIFTSNLETATGTISVTTSDYTTEGAETFTISVRSGSVSGPVIVTSSAITINDTTLTQTATMTPTATTITEGSTVTINVSTSNVPTGSQLTWRIVHGTTVAGDFSATSGLYNSGFGSGSFSVTTATGDGTEGAETFQVELLGSGSQRIGITSAITISANIT